MNCAKAGFQRISSSKLCVLGQPWKLGKADSSWNGTAVRDMPLAAVRDMPLAAVLAGLSYGL